MRRVYYFAEPFLIQVTLSCWFGLVVWVFLILHSMNVTCFHTGKSLGPGPGILLINLCSTVLAANHWALQLVILPIIGFSALLFTVLALFIIPKASRFPVHCSSLVSKCHRLLGMQLFVKHEFCKDSQGESTMDHRT